LVAAVEACGVPAHLPQHVRERARAAAATPAVDERPPAARLPGEALLDRARDVARGDRRAEPLRLEGRLLLVDGADERALLVVEHRNVDRAGQVVLGELRGTARVENVVEAADVRESEQRGDQRLGSIAVERQLRHDPFFASSGSSVRHTLSTSVGCAAAVGCSWSGWKSSGCPATPARRNGTSATLSSFATFG